MDKEVHASMQEKYRLDLEKDVVEWIQSVVEHGGGEARAVPLFPPLPPFPQRGDDSSSPGDELQLWLEDGVVLLHLLFCLSGGDIPLDAAAMAPLHVLEKQGNINLYLSLCPRVAPNLPQADLFICSDLLAGKCLTQVLQHLLSLARCSQVLPSCPKGAIKIGPTYSVSLEDFAERETAREQEREEERRRQEKISRDRLQRRLQLEDTARQNSIKDLKAAEVKVLERRLTKGRISQNDFGASMQSVREKFER